MPESSVQNSNAALRNDVPIALYVVAHTHWDREWYRTADEFRLGLVDLVDELLDGKSEGPFLLDGQTIVLEDYLRVRGDRREELARALRDGWLEAGPWYVLGDSLIPSGESMVRNLLEGRRMLRTFGAEAPPVLYAPDSFGHSGALPTIAAGFGFEVAIAWRGIGRFGTPPSDAFRWRAADGSEVLVYHLAPDGYELGASLPTDDERMRARWARLAAVLLPRATLGVALLPNGADHHAVQDTLTEALDALQRAAAPVRIRRSTLREFAGALVERAHGRELPWLEREQRDSSGYTWSLQGTFSARTHQKRLNARAERLLLRDVEPWTALARWSGATTRRHATAELWRTLLQCHPHDTLCGCSIDEVARAMESRMGGVTRGASLAGERARRTLLGHDDEVAHERLDDWRPRVIVRNAVPRLRSGVVECEVQIPIAKVGVGPDSVSTTMPYAGSSRLTIGMPSSVAQRIDSDTTFARVESPRHYPRNFLVETGRYLAWMEAVPGMSLRSVALATRDRTPRAPHPLVSVLPNEISNDSLRVSIEDGELDLQTTDGRLYPAFVLVEDAGEAGDLYTHGAISGTAQRGHMVSHELLHDGPLRATLTSEWEVTVAARRVERATSDGSARAWDSLPEDRLRLTMEVSLDAASPYVRVRVVGENAVRNHRLRVRFATGAQGPATYADAAFGFVSRATTGDLPIGDAREAYPSTAPLHRWVAAYAGSGGAAVLSDGLAEYEADDDGSIAITLLRATDELSRANRVERSGHAGWPARVPDAQLLGRFEANFAVLPIAGSLDDCIVAIERACDDFLTPLTGETLLSALAEYPPTPTLELSGDGLVFSSCKESDDGQGIILRCRNVRNAPVEGRWSLGGVRRAWLARMDETPLTELQVDGDGVSFTAPPRGVVTILVVGGKTPQRVAPRGA